MGLQSHLQALGLDLVTAYEALEVPASLVDAQGVCLWQNDAARALFGDQRGRAFSPIAPDYLQNARASLARKATGADRATYGGVALIDVDGRRRQAQVTSLSLFRDRTLVAILSIVNTVSPPEPEWLPRPLSPREHQALLLLAHGLTTAQIAERLGIASETARNHIRGVMRALGVHSRVAAVARARELDLV